MTSRRFTILIVSAAIASSVVGCVHYGQRLLEAKIERDGQTVLRTQFSVPDNSEKLIVWKQLESQLFEATDPKALGPDTAGRTKLTGTIQITLTHAGRVCGVVAVDELQISQHDAGTNIWQLAPGEVERALDAEM